MLLCMCIQGHGSSIERAADDDETQPMPSVVADSIASDFKPDESAAKPEAAQDDGKPVRPESSDEVTK